MGGSIPKEKEKCYILQEKKKYFDGVKCRPPKVQNYIWLQNIIITIAIITGCRKSFHYMGL